MGKTCIEKIHEIIELSRKNSNCEIEVRYDEPMNKHTTFKVGGPADCWLCPKGEGFPAFSAVLLSHARKAEVPVFILGGGANIVVSDKGIRGIVLDTALWKGRVREQETVVENQLIFRSGTNMDEAGETAAAAGLSGLEFLAGMPGAIGGAVWMNARCYGSEIADIFAWAQVIDFSGYAYEEPTSSGGIFQIGKRITVSPCKSGFGYKRSPFQEKEYLITAACFNLLPGDKSKICHLMEKNRKDREIKGHYLFPCAGSAFKNNHDFGKPAGLIIDELGLRGFSIGGAQVAPFHGNIVINTGGAAAADIRALIGYIAAKVNAAAGFVLEPEVIFIGEW